MGIIIKQSIKGAVWSYLGVIIGFITTAYIYPNYLTTEIVGLFALLIAWSDLFAQFSMLGFQGVTARLFPYFRDKAKGHNGFLFIAFTVMLTGFALSVITFFFLRGWLVQSNLEKSALFVDYVNVLIPLIFFALLFNFLDSFIKMLYDAVLASFLKEFLQRILILSILLLYVFGLISPNVLVLAYAGAVCFKGAFLFFYLLARKEINLSPQLGFIDGKLKKEMISVAVFSILTGIGGSIVFQIDKIIINQVMGLSATGVYTIAFFFGTLVVIPSRTLLKISGTLIADAWKRNDLKTIADIYRKSCINQFIIAAFLFGGIWINVDNILIILGPEYAEGKWVIFFIGLGYLIDMATGTNGTIISLSKYYRMGLWFLLILVITVVGAMFVFIPVWGITGAAMAIALAFFMNNLMRWLFLVKKYHMQPFGFNFLLVPLAFFVSWGGAMLVPEFSLFPDILVRSSVFTILFATQVYLFRISEDVINMVHSILARLKEKFG